jgi:Cu-processing system ATP-binding protein
MMTSTPRSRCGEGASSAISFANVSKHYGSSTVLRDVSMAISAGECVGLLGPNGAGKTTMFKLMLGLITPDEGAVTVAGETPSAAAFCKVKTGIGYLPENVVFDGGISGRAMLGFYGRLKSVRQKACDDLMDLVGLTAAASRPVRTYSKGMRQRLGLAQALLGDPGVLFFDEPTTGLDPTSRRQFFTLLKEQRSRGTTIIMSSHALAEVEAQMKRFAILKHGRLLAFGTLDELKKLAGLETRIRLTVSPGSANRVADHFDGHVRLSYVNEKSVHLSCLDSTKMFVMRELATLEEQIEDVEVSAPQLDDLFAHFMAQGESA